jgi:thiol-disulfide isomerase/thioredoxin
MRLSRIATSLFYCFVLAVLNTGTINTAYAAQNSSKESSQQHAARIAGKVTQVIIASGVTYVEVDVGSNKVWAAAVGVAPVKKGEKIAFMTDMLMNNYHSKNLDRNFAVIYFVKQFLTGGEASASGIPLEQITQKPSMKPEVAKLLAKTSEVRIGGFLREVSLDGLQGKPKRFSDFRGKPLIINVWASWCGPCRAEMGALQHLADLYNGDEFNIIGISIDDHRDRALALIEQTGITFENFIDHKLVLEKMLGANAIPLTILVDDQGRVLEKVRGAREWDSPDMINAIGQVFNIELQN